jgi:hypothetical protein
MFISSGWSADMSIQSMLVQVLLGPSDARRPAYLDMGSKRQNVEVNTRAMSKMKKKKAQMENK